MQMRRMNNVALNHHIFINKISRISIVRHNPSHFCRRQINLVNTFSGKERLHRTGVQQIKLVASTQHQFYVISLRQLSDDGGPHHPAMARHKNTLCLHPQYSSAMATS